MPENEKCCFPCPWSRTHAHEVQGSVICACGEGEAHNHRFAAVSGPAIPYGEFDHVHEIRTNTDSHEGHFHEICGTTSGMIRVGDRHVHFIDGETTRAGEDNHRHDFRAASLIEDPV